jgi:hypothetical protein
MDDTRAESVGKVLSNSSFSSGTPIPQRACSPQSPPTDSQHLTRFLTAVTTRDEENLEENERLKQELNPRKIDEPKTPYLSPLETTTDDETERTFFLGKR